MRLNIYDSKEKLSEGLASWICDLIQSTLKNQEFFTIALSGGETPQMLYKKLASEEYKEKINWRRMHIFWGDERAVPSDDDRNNAKMAFKSLIGQVSIPPAQVHKMRVDIEPLFAAKDYENVLQTYFGNTEKSFDLILLGIGDDGHTLSLFPACSRELPRHASSLHHTVHVRHIPAPALWLFCEVHVKHLLFYFLLHWHQKTSFLCSHLLREPHSFPAL